MTTYSGTTLSIANEVPATYDRKGFRALNYELGACALREVPAVVRKWDKVTDDLVCRNTDYSIKGGAKWDPVTFKLNRMPTDAAQEIYTELEASPDGVGSFKLVLPGFAGTIYFTAQVSMFALADGGNKNTIHSGSVELLLQGDPICILDERFAFTNASSLTHSITTDDGEPYSIDYGNGPVEFSSGAEHTQVLPTVQSGVAKISLSDAQRITVLRFNDAEWSPDLTSFSDLKSLTKLQLFSTGVTGDIATLSGLKSMNNLQLNNTGVTGDVASIAVLMSLTILRLDVSGVTGDIGSLSALPLLDNLRLNSTGVTGDIASLSVLTSLTNLQLYNTNIIGDIASMAPLTSLIALRLDSTGVTGDLSSISGLTSLYSLLLFSTGVTGDIASLSGLTSLVTFYLYNTGQITNSASLASPLFIQYRLGSAMNQTEIAATLSALNASGISGANILLSYDNAAPPASAQSDIDALTARGNAVTTN